MRNNKRRALASAGAASKQSAVADAVLDVVSRALFAMCRWKMVGVFAYYELMYAHKAPVVSVAAADFSTSLRRHSLHKWRAGHRAQPCQPLTTSPLNTADYLQANRKGVRCCVECGATSTPQWREGPMGT